LSNQVSFFYWLNYVFYPRFLEKSQIGPFIFMLLYLVHILTNLMQSGHFR